MNPAWSVIFLTTLLGAGQGLFVAMWLIELFGHGRDGSASPAFFIVGGVIVMLLLALGLAASFFHLGRPERAWRAAAMWRTSWLSREVIALPLFGALVFCWTVAHYTGAPFSLALGLLALLACVALFICTAMIYASIRFLQEWASAWTMVNYIVLGLASGFTLVTALAAFAAPRLATICGVFAFVLTLIGLVTRSLSLARNARLKPRSTLQTALGIKHPQIRQRAMGFMGGSFNTREFFHHATPGGLKQVKWWFIAGAFVLPLLLLGSALSTQSSVLAVLAFAVQYLGLLAERWFFFAQANHPQNLYYQTVS